MAHDKSNEISRAGKAMMDAVLVHWDLPKDQAESICISGVKKSFPYQPEFRLRQMFEFYWTHCGGKI